MKKVNENQLYDLLALKLSGDASNEQLQCLQQLLERHPEWQFLHDQLMKPSVWQDNEELTAQAYAAHFVKMQLQGKFDAPDADKTPVQRQPRVPVYRKIAWTTAIAASLIGIIILVQFNRKSIAEHPLILNEVSTKKGSTSNIKLPDGTSVWLNADSKLTYKEDFGSKNREVILTGEAYFDVMHDADHPFIIHTGKTDIKVLGTAFNVRNYPQDNAMEATLMRGKIEVTLLDRPNEKIILRPLEKIIVTKQLAPDTADNLPVNRDEVVLTSVSYSNADSLVAETSWVKHKIVFINQPLEKIAQELERKFAVSIMFKSNETKNYRYTGIFDTEKVDEILEILSLSKKISYTISNKQITIE